jgi:hypothetical protein
MAAADGMPVIDRALRSIAVVTSAVIALSFVLFAVEEVREASNRQVAVVSPGAEQESRRAAGHTKAREALDDVNDVILRPFAGVPGNAENVWALRGIPALLGLLLYGLGLAYLARRLDVRAHTIVRHTPPAPPPQTHSKPPPGPA